MPIINLADGANIMSTIKVSETQKFRITSQHKRKNKTAEKASLKKVKMAGENKNKTTFYPT